MKMWKRALSFLLALAMLAGFVPAVDLTAFAADSPYGIAAGTYPGDRGKITFTVDHDGVLTWTSVSGATSYDLNIYMHGSLFKSEEGNTSRS